MDVTVIGCGYVGLVTGTCLASIGHTVRGVEKGREEAQDPQDGHCPIFEPGLQELMQENYASGQLQFTDNVKAAVKDAEVVFLCVGTPPKPDGTVDMSYLEAAGKEVCDALAEQNNDYMVTIIVKSTVPAGTNRKLYNFLKSRPRPTCRSSPTPSSSKEGTGGQDCLNPDRIVIGGESPEAFRMMRRLYDPLVKREENFMTMNWESAELTKYAANTMLAARISFMNEMTILCEHYGADIEDIRKGIGTDNRIGPAFLARRLRLRRIVLPQGRRRDGAHLQGRRAREPVRPRHPDDQQEPEEALRRQDRAEARPADRRRDDRRVGPGVQGRHRRHPRIGRHRRHPLSARRGAHVKAHDYKAMENMKQVFKDQVEWCHDPVTAAAGADAVALLTDWPQYTTLPFRKIAATMNQPIIFDGRNCLHRDVMRETGFQYYPMGRPAVENTLRLKTSGRVPPQSRAPTMLPHPSKLGATGSSLLHQSKFVG